MTTTTTSMLLQDQEQGSVEATVQVKDSIVTGAV